MKKLKKNKGITLIALVITIIVLLILAGVSLKLISGSDGIISKSSNAVDETVKASAEEELNLLVSEYLTDYYYDKYAGDGTTSVGTLAEYIASKMGSGKNADRGTITISGTTLTYTATDGETILATLEINDVGTSNGDVTPKVNYTVTIAKNEDSYGTVTSSSLSVPEGTTYTIGEATITFSNGMTVEASIEDASGYTTTFEGWTIGSETMAEGTVTGDVTITANFARTTTAITYTSYSVEQEVTVDGKSEGFYVLFASGASESTVTLLCKTTIGNATWSAANTQASTYGTGVGGTGRLLSLDEANALNSTIRTIGDSYWLSTSKSQFVAYRVLPRGGTNDTSNYNEFGVRPVITVSKSIVH